MKRLIDEFRRRLLEFSWSLLGKKYSPKTVRKTVIVLFVFTLVLTTYFLSIPFIKKPAEYRVGDIVNEDIRVLYDVRYINKEVTESLRKEAFNKERLYFSRDYNVLRKITEQLNRELNLLSASSSENRQAEREALLKELSARPSLYNPGVIENLPPGPAVQWAVRYATLIFDNYGIIKDTPSNEMRKELSVSGVLIKTSDAPGRSQDILWEGYRIIGAQEIFSSYAYRRLAQLADPDMERLLPEETRSFLVHRILALYQKNPYVEHSPKVTARKKELAAASISPVFESLRRGEYIAHAGDPVDRNMEKKIEAMNQFYGKANKRYIAAYFLIMALMSVSVGFFIHKYSGIGKTELSSHIIFHSLIIGFFSIALLVSMAMLKQQPGTYFGLLIPAGAFSALLTVLFNPRVTLITGIFSTVYLYILSAYDTSTLLFSIISLVTGIYSAARMKKRTQLFKGSLVMGTAYAIIVLAMELLNTGMGSKTLINILLAYMNAYASLIIMTGILPLYEVIFNIPTKFRLQELADYESPLLKKMAVEAPSTYNHSMMLANLTERAVSAIGGDVLLAKTGCLYHDIGKTNHPEFYIENRNILKNTEKHTPEEKAKIIVSHVTDGIVMGRKMRLPEAIIKFIPEHHGTTTMLSVYHEAMHQPGKKPAPDVADFSYPGPIPQSRETAVVMLADTIEAASRSLSDFSPETIMEMIDRLVQSKINAGQLKESGLSFGDVDKIKAAFLETLLSVYHSRPEYPSSRKKGSAVSREKNARTRKANSGSSTQSK